jgi:hypothetical protein
LNRWGDITGLNDKELSGRYESQLKHNGPLVVAALAQLALVLKDLRRTELKYDFSEAQEVEDADKSSEAVPAIATKAADIAERNAQSVVRTPSAALKDVTSTQLAVPLKRLSVARRIRTAFKRVAKEPKRFRWVLRDSKKFEKALVYIAQLVKYLEDMLSQDQMDSLEKSANDFKLMLLQLTTDVGEMKALLWASQIEQPRNSDGSSAATLSGETLVNVEGVTVSQLEYQGTVSVSKPTAFWIAATQFSIAVTESFGKSKASNRLPEGVMNEISFGQTLERDSRTSATMGNGDRIWIEWRSFSLEPTIKDGRAEWQVPEETLERVELLVALLKSTDRPIAFCVPRCLGYFQDDYKKMFGLIFEPPVKTGCWPPRSLLSCYGTIGITLEAKFNVAKDLAQWLLYLQALNWLHKGLRSASVLFFSSADPKHPGQPYVSGFDYSRTVQSGTTPGPDIDDVERAMYTHPNYLGGKRKLGFKKTYDMYSLGILLVEIAFWRPINVILGFAPSHQSNNSAEAQAAVGAQREHENGKTKFREDRHFHDLPQAKMSQVMVFKDRLLNEDYLDQIAGTMGGAYAAATRVCLEGMTGLELADDHDQSDVSVAAMMQQGFIDKVVDVLGRISV